MGTPVTTENQRQSSSKEVWLFTIILEAWDLLAEDEVKEGTEVMQDCQCMETDVRVESRM